MRDFNRLLKSTAVFAVTVGTTVGLANISMAVQNTDGAHSAQRVQSSANPAAQKRPVATAQIKVASNSCNPCNPCAVKKNPCNPCAAKNPCNPCAAKNPCNPCATKNPCNPCNPCAAKKNACNPCNPCAASSASQCVVPSLAAANPCAGKNPCNPCAAKNPCNPCAAKNPCNPCAAKNPCNPCAAANPCNPCGAAEAPELTPAEALAAYNCIQKDLATTYAKANLPELKNYTGWENVATSPYQAATHGNRYVNNWVNAVGAQRYRKYEDVGTMPVGSVIAKDSFEVSTSGQVKPGPMFVMEKMADGFQPDLGNWKYTMIMPNGSVFGQTNGKNSAGMVFCSDCHASGEDQDYLLFLPDEVRK